MCPRVEDQPTSGEFIVGDISGDEYSEENAELQLDVEPAAILANDEWLTSLADRCKELLVEKEIERLIGVPHTHIVSAEKLGQLPLTIYGGKQGYRVNDVAAWIRKHGIAFKLSQTALLMLTARPVEVIDADAIFSVWQVADNFGIPASTTIPALAAGKIRDVDGVTWCNAGRISGHGLLSWVKADGVPVRPSMTIAAKIAHQRRVAAELAAGTVTVTDAQPTVVSRVFDAIDEQRRLDEAGDVATRQAQLRAYRDILRRRDSNLSMDTSTFLELVSELILSEEIVARDIAIIEKAAALEELIPTVAEKAAALSACETVQERTLRHKREDQEGRLRWSKANNEHQAAAAAAGELRELKRLRPELFV